MKKPAKTSTGTHRTITRKNVSAKSPVAYNNTGKKESYSPLQKAEQDLTLLLDHTEESFLLVGTDFRIIIFNKQFHTLYTKYFNRNINKGDNILDHAVSGHSTALEQVYRKVFAGEKFDLEFELSPEGQSSLTFTNRYKPAYDNEGHIIGAVVTSTDITEKKKSRQQLIANEQRFRALVENGIDGVAILTPEGKPLYMSPAVHNILGYSEEEAMDLEMFMVVHPEDHLAMKRFMAEVVGKPGVPVRGPVVRVLHKNRTWRLVEGTTTNMLHEPSVRGLVSNFRDVTERIEAEKEKKHAQENIRIAKERYDLVARATNEAIWDWDIMTEDVLWGEGFKTLFGYDDEIKPVTLHSWSNYIHPDDAQRVINSIMQVVCSPHSNRWEAEYRFIRADGSCADVLDRGFVIRDAEGTPVRMIGGMQDITERNLISQQLKDAYDFNETIIETSPVGILMFEESGQATRVNKAAIELHGGDLAKWMDFNFKESECWKALGLHGAAMEALETGKSVRLEVRGMNTEHKEVWYEAFITPVRFKGKKHIVLMTYDIKERMQAEERLKKSEAQLSVATQLAKLGYWELDIEKGMFTFNDHFYDILKTTAEEMGGYTMSAQRYSELFLHSEDVELVAHEVKMAIENPNPFYCRDLEHRIVYANGETGHLAVRFYVVKDEQGRTIRTIGANQDITERKKHEIAINELNDQLNNRAEELAASNAELERFAYVASHDLQEPLRMVSSFLQLLEKKYENQLDETAIQYINYAVDGADRMKRLILDLLEYSRVGTSKETLVCTDMTKIVKQVMDIFSTKIAETSAKVTVHAMPEIKANASQVSQLIQNLVGNALKYNKSAIPELEIGCEEKKDAWQFYIKDNGIGIDPKYYNKVFVIFQRLHGKNQFSGTGIGLAICKKIVEKHGGNIWIESAVGKGSTFFFTIKK
jgi:PAS domain S-box-containing protein